MAIPDRVFPVFIKKKWRGKSRLFNLLVKLGFRKIFTFNAKYGLQLNLSPNEYIDNIIVREGFYESEVTDEILLAMRHGGTLWDIGANIGIHSIAVKKQIPNVTVYSFEPNPKTLGQLHENALLNEAKINVCGFALHEQASVMALYITEGNSGMTTLVPAGGYNSTVQCLTVTGDFLLAQGFEQPTVIKLDTEGSELSILRGCNQVLADPRLKLILFEAYNDLLEDEKNEILILLKYFGFDQIQKLVRAEQSQHDLSNFTATRLQNL